jgi:hypothetical protein
MDRSGTTSSECRRHHLFKIPGQCRSSLQVDIVKDGTLTCEVLKDYMAVEMHSKQTALLIGKIAHARKTWEELSDVLILKAFTLYLMSQT